MSKKVSEEQVEQLLGVYNKLDSNYLTEKELDRAEKFIEDLHGFGGHVGYQLGEYNGFKSYIDALRIKAEKRQTIPGWYMDNKYNK